MASGEGGVVLTSYSKVKTDIPGESKFEAFLSEMQSIRESLCEDGQDVEEPSEEGEEEEVWLNQLGLEKIVSKIKALGDDASADLEEGFALTASQVATIRRRVDTLSHTLKKRVNVMRPDLHEVFAPHPQQSEGQTIQQQQQSVEEEEEEVEMSQDKQSDTCQNDEGVSCPLNVDNSSSLTESSRQPSVSSDGRQQVCDECPQGDDTLQHKTGNHQNGITTPDPSGQTLSTPSSVDPSTTAVTSEEDEDGSITLDVLPDSPQATKKQVKGDTLPKFTIAPDPLGITRLGDLSSEDMKKVRRLALIELTSTFDQHGLALRMPKAEKVKSVKDHGVFGVPLQVLVQLDRQRVDHVQIPLFIHEAIQFLEEHGLETEGILRVPGATIRMKAMKQELETVYNSGGFSWEDRRVSDVASLLKQFLRELPSPLLTREYMRSFACIPSISTLKEQIKALNLLILLLPEIHQNSLKRLLDFLEKIVQHSDVNKMHLENVAMVIAPNLFYNLPRTRDSAMDELTLANHSSHVVKLMLRYHRLLWTIPGEMLNQVRTLSEAGLGNKKSKRHIFQPRRHKEIPTRSKAAQAFEMDNAIIRVHAPFFMRVTMAVGLSYNMTAGDIVQKLKKKSHLNEEEVRRRTSVPFSDENVVALADVSHFVPVVHPEEQFVFEIGGNIGERCLDPKTNMWAMYQVNPTAHWVIKPRNCPDIH